MMSYFKHISHIFHWLCVVIIIKYFQETFIGWVITLNRVLERYTCFTDPVLPSLLVGLHCKGN